MIGPIKFCLTITNVINCLYQTIYLLPNKATKFDFAYIFILLTSYKYTEIHFSNFFCFRKKVRGTFVLDHNLPSFFRIRLWVYDWICL